MNVLSLFDGMSCGQIAFDRVGIEIENYFASEIKPHAIKVTEKNFPSTMQIGDVRKVRGSDLPDIDVMIGGSPCQDFSRAHSSRLGLRGDKSSLFYEWLRLLDECNPKCFLLENVVMPFNDEALITNELGIRPIRINSSLVSGQLRDRLYWTNIGNLESDMFGMKTNTTPQPKDKCITLQSCLDGGWFTNREKSRALLESDSRPLASKDKMYRRYINGFTTIKFKSEDCDWKKGIEYLNQAELERLQTVPPGYTSCLTRNHAACLLGDGWTVDVVAHIFREGLTENPT